MSKKTKETGRSSFLSLLLWVAISAILFLLDKLFPSFLPLKAGISALRLLMLLTSIMAGAQLASALTHFSLARQQKPVVEGRMVSGLYRLVAVIAIILVIAFGFGQLSAFGQFFTLFGGMILGWSLQAPVSGFAAWALISLKRPFRPGDRVQFPGLGLTGDVQEVGLMYTVLNQVGGSISSEEAVGRFILLPNAMLFSQVAINYTVLQEAAYMLDEVVVRLTYDSDWEAAERIMISAATEVTQDVIEATGEKPYIRSDPYDYGVYLRLRYRTQVALRAATSYEINKRIFKAIQGTRSVDLAIPYIYSYRAGAERKIEANAANADRELANVRDIAVARVKPTDRVLDDRDVEQLARSIEAQGLLQPIIVVEDPSDGSFEVAAGHLRFEACKKLGWKTIPAVVHQSKPDTLA